MPRVGATSALVVLFGLLGKCQGANMVESRVAEPNLVDGEMNPFAFHMFENFEATLKVFNKEEKLVEDLKKVRDLLKKNRALTQRIVKRGEHFDNATDAENPINAFLMIKHLTLASQNEMKEIWENTEQVANLLLDVTNTTKDFPDATDYRGAVNGLAVLHDTYKFDLPFLAEGDIYVHSFPPYGEEVFLQTDQHLSIEDFATLAKHAYQKTWYDESIAFTRQFFFMAEKEQVNQSVMAEMERLRKNLVELNNKYLEKKRALMSKTYKITPYIVDKDLKIKKKQPKWIKKGISMFDNDQGTMAKEAYFRTVCSGFTTRVYKGDHYFFKCHYLHHNDPFLRLAPFLIEVASEEPYIIVLHKFFSEAEMNYLVDTSKPKLSRTRIRDDANRGSPHEFRSGKRRRIVHKTVQHWLQDIRYEDMGNTDLANDDTNFNYTILDKILFKLSKKIETATMLNATNKWSSTEYQTTNYGLGGLCEVHIDPHGYLEGAELPPSRYNLRRSGDMIATLMGWIGGEPVGGATAFVYLFKEITVWPTKGSAAFWFNLNKRGYRDRRTAHGGCPVLKGSKWILNKWIYYFDQFQKYPCGLEISEFVKPFSAIY